MKGHSSKRRRPGSIFFMHAALCVFAVTALAPLGLVLINSFKTHAQIVRNPLSLPAVLSFANFTEAWVTGKFGRGFVNSIMLSGCTILIVLVSASLAGYVLAGKRVRGSSLILMYFMIAMTVPVQLFLFPLYFVMANLRLIGKIPAVSFIIAAINMPLSVSLMRTFFLNVPKELEEAARIDGASTRQVLWNIMVPIVSPGLITVSVIVGLQSWNEYLLTSTFLQGEGNFTATLGFLSMNGTYSSDQGIMMAGAVIMIAPVILFFVSVQKYFIDGLVSGAVKG
jgi:raffinose/stachyose/melibiose transport system permease protein